MEHATYKSYVIGFVASLVLTVSAYLAVTNHMFMGVTLISIIAGLAIIQLIVQLYFFLHLGQESKPRWNLTVFLFMLMVLVIIVFGSLWIMNNLDYQMMSGHQLDQNIMQEEGIYKRGEKPHY